MNVNINGYEIKGNVIEIKELLGLNSKVNSSRKVYPEFNLKHDGTKAKLIVDFINEHKGRQFTSKEIQIKTKYSNTAPRLTQLFRGNVIGRTEERPYKYFSLERELVTVNGIHYSSSTKLESDVK